MSDTPIGPGVRRSRNAIVAEVQVTLGGRRARLPILDLSLSGLRAGGGEALGAETGQACQLRFPLDADTPLALRATVVRSQAGELAFRFVEPVGEDEDALHALIQRRGQLLDNCED